MTAIKNLCLAGMEYKDETFGELTLCNFEGTLFDDCVFTDTVYGCNFTDAVFSVCSFATGVFIGCNFTGATGIEPTDITGEANNFEGVK